MGRGGGCWCSNALHSLCLWPRLEPRGGDQLVEATVHSDANTDIKTMRVYTLDDAGRTRSAVGRKLSTEIDAKIGTCESGFSLEGGGLEFWLPFLSGTSSFGSVAQAFWSLIVDTPPPPFEHCLGMS